MVTAGVGSEDVSSLTSCNVHTGCNCDSKLVCDLFTTAKQAEVNMFV